MEWLAQFTKDDIGLLQNIIYYNPGSLAEKMLFQWYIYRDTHHEQKYEPLIFIKAAIKI